MYWGFNGPWDGWFWGFGGLLFAVLIVWTLVWKGLALWRAAKHSHKVWFIALLLINTAGILEILYIYFFSKKKWAK